MKLNNLHDLFILKLKTLYYIETQIIKALPKMARKASDPKLKTAFKDHLEETRGHIERLEKVFESLEMKPSKIKVEAIQGLIADAEWIIAQKPATPALDAVLIASGEYVEHYEMAKYKSLRDWALILGNNEAADLLEETLKEEKAASVKLNIIAQDGVNELALPLQ